MGGQVETCPPFLRLEEAEMTNDEWKMSDSGLGPFFGFLCAAFLQDCGRKTV